MNIILLFQLDFINYYLYVYNRNYQIDIILIIYYQYFIKKEINTKIYKIWIIRIKKMSTKDQKVEAKVHDINQIKDEKKEAPK